MCSGVTAHQGTDPNVGHYFSYLKHPVHGWLRADDEHVRLSSWAEVKNQQAYILIFQAAEAPVESPPSSASWFAKAKAWLPSV